MDKSKILHIKGGIKLVCFFFLSHRIHVWYIYIWLKLSVNVGTCAILIGTFEGYFFRKKNTHIGFRSLRWCHIFHDQLVRKMQMRICRSSWLVHNVFCFRLFTNQKMKDTIHWVQTSGNLHIFNPKSGWLFVGL